MRPFLISFLLSATTLFAAPVPIAEPSPTTEHMKGCYTGRIADGEHGGLFAEFQLDSGTKIYVPISTVADVEYLDPKCSDKH
jgi:hypothetical protein